MTGALLSCATLVAAMAIAVWLTEHTQLFDRLSDWLLHHAGGWGE